MPSDVPADQASKPLTPEVTWAQRSSKDDASKNFIWITILASDVSEKDTKIDLQPDHVSFSGYSQSKKAQYAVQLDFFAEVDPSQSKIHHSARAIEMKLQKKDLKEEYWPRLLKESKKMHFLKTDFDKWADEDEQEGVLDDDYMSSMGGMPGADGGFGGLDFSKLGGGAGGMGDLAGAMGGAGGMGMDMDEDEEDDGEDGEDDDDMPELEDDKKPAGASSSKIQEVE